MAVLASMRGGSELARDDFASSDQLAQSLAGSGGSVRAVGDAYSPGTIAAAVWDGRRYAEELDAEPADPDEAPFLREVAELSTDQVRGSII